MTVSLEFLEASAAATGFQVGGLEKITRLGTLAEQVSQHPRLGRSLVLKGGIALNLGFGEPHRLSVDLDFNYVGAVGRDAMLADRPEVEDALVELVRRAGYRVQLSADAFAGRKLYLHYRSVLGAPDRIEVDLNYLHRLPLVPAEARELWQPGDLDRPRVRTVGLEELLVGKCLALLDRGAARDAWDVARLAPGPLECLASSRFRTLFVALSGVLDHPVTTYTESRVREQVTERAIKDQLMPMLQVGHDVVAADLIDLAWARVKPLVDLDANETAYVQALQHGDLHLELLFPDQPNEAERLSTHPALLWKTHNARRHGEGQED